MKTLAEMRRLARGTQRPAARWPILPLIGAAALAFFVGVWWIGALPAEVSAQLPGHKRGLGAYDGAARWLHIPVEEAREQIEAAEAGDREAINRVATQAALMNYLRGEIIMANGREISEEEMHAKAFAFAGSDMGRFEVENYRRALRVDVKWLLAK